MAPPGSLDARYERLAGTEDRRRELYIVRRHLGYTIDEWLRLPWWQRRLYIEQMGEEAAEADQAQGGRAAAGGGSDPVEALLSGTLDDVARAGFKTT